MATIETDDIRRVAGISAYDVLHKPPRRELLAVVDLAARITGVPMATINLITDTEQHQIATVGFDSAVCSREDSMCAAILHEEAPVVVADASIDPRFAGNPFVTGELGDVRFYAAHKLVTHEGLAIGSLCVFDIQPRTLSVEQASALGTLAERIVDILELSLKSRELARTLARVEAMKAELERSNERLASFAGQVSHDLKNPLTSVAMSLSMIREVLETDQDTEDAKWLLERAISGSSRMAALIDDVLEYAKLGGSLRAEKVDLDQVLRQVLDDLGGALVGVTVDAHPLPAVIADEVQIRSVLQNLIGNAAKFRAPARASTIEIRAERRTRAWRISVTDNGRGIPPEHRSRVFEPLARADATVAGSGIGLATCRRIMEAHDGEIGLEPVPTGGTRVWFELPV